MESLNTQYKKATMRSVLLVTLIIQCTSIVVNAQDNSEEGPVWFTEDSSEKNVTVAVASRINYDLSKNDIATQIFNDCECVIHYLCDDENYIVTDGKGIIDIR